MSFSYQWLRSGVAIDGATNNTYTLTEADNNSSISCRVTAANIYGSTPAVSNAYTVGEAVLWTPYFTDTDFWFSAANPENITIDVGVSQWDDLSGGGRHLMQATGSYQPTYNTTALSVDNNGTSGVRLSTGVFTEENFTAYHLFIVATAYENRASIPAQSSSGTSFYTNDAANNNAVTIGGNSGTTTGPVNPILSISGNGLQLTETRNSLAPYLISRASSVGTGNKACYHIARAAATAIQSSINFGTPVNGAIPTVATLTMTSFGAPSVYSNVAGTFNGGIHELIFIKGTLTAEEVEYFEGYLAWEHGLEVNLPSGHTYESAPPYVGG